jgi:hypothetical protein
VAPADVATLGAEPVLEVPSKASLESSTAGPSGSMTQPSSASQQWRH